LVVGEVVGAGDVVPGVGHHLDAAQAAVGHAAGGDLDEVLPRHEAAAEVGVEVGGGEVLVGAVLDPQHQGLAGGDHRVGRGRGPQRRVGRHLVGVDVEVVDGEVGVVDRTVGGVVELDELIRVGACDVGGVGRHL